MSIPRRWRRSAIAASCAVAVVAATVPPAFAQGVSVVRITSDDAGPRCVQIRDRGGATRRERSCRAVARAGRLARASSATYQNPVFGSFPDPMAHFTGVEYYAYSTGSRFPVIRSTDLVNWETIGTAFATSPGWSSGNPWAPSALAHSQPCADRPPGSTSNACYYLYYVGLNNQLATPSNCIGVATADAPAGPFRDHGILTRADGTVHPVRGPIGCGDSAGYSNIDPAPFVDGATGKAYLYLSTGHDASGAWNRKAGVIPLAADRIRASSSRRVLFGATRSWEGGVVEGPWMHKRSSTYYLFYSGGNWSDASYGMGYATSSSPTGTFFKASANPVLKSTAAVIGPGGGSVTAGPHGGDWMVYHGRAIAGGPRTLRIDPLVWNTAYAPARVTVRGPTTTPQPVP
jgi:arabinan endo-1,5-alpha-L-arabinosidase